MCDMPKQAYLRDDGSGYGFVELTHRYDSRGSKYIRADLAAEEGRDLVEAASALLNHANGNFTAADGERGFLIHDDFIHNLQEALAKHKEQSDD